MRIQLELPNEVAAELAGPGDQVMKTLEEHLDTARGNPYGITVLVEDFEDQTAAIQAELHQALNGGDFTVTAVTSLLAQISEIGSIARTL